MAFNPTYARVENEGANLFYWYQGSGPLLILVAGGGGNGNQFNGVLPYLATKYTAVTFDRRQHSKSTVSGPLQQANPAQHARDVLAIAKALGHDKISVYGNSGGGIICLQLAASYPERVEHMIVHEAPTTALLPDATYHLDRCFQILAAYKAGGSSAAMGVFGTEFRGYENTHFENSAFQEDAETTEKNRRNFFENEFIQWTIYCPDLRKVKAAGVKLAVARGEGSRDAFYARTVDEQAKVLGLERKMVPGHHTWFTVEPEVFSKAMLEIFEGLETKR